jgi:hypothetical protein
MFRRSRLALAITASLGLAALAPDTAAAFAIGHDRIAPFGRNGTPFRSEIRLNNAAVNARFRCHSVQVGDPRKQPPMLVCP